MREAPANQESLRQDHRWPVLRVAPVHAHLWLHAKVHRELSLNAAHLPFGWPTFWPHFWLRYLSDIFDPSFNFLSAYYPNGPIGMELPEFTSQGKNMADSVVEETTGAFKMIGIKIQNMEVDWAAVERLINAGAAALKNAADVYFKSVYGQGNQALTRMCVQRVGPLSFSTPTEQRKSSALPAEADALPLTASSLHRSTSTDVSTAFGWAEIACSACQSVAFSVAPSVASAARGARTRSSAAPHRSASPTAAKA